MVILLGSLEDSTCGLKPRVDIDGAWTLSWQTVLSSQADIIGAIFTKTIEFAHPFRGERTQIRSTHWISSSMKVVSRLCTAVVLNRRNVEMRTCVRSAARYGTLYIIFQYWHGKVVNLKHSHGTSLLQACERSGPKLL